MKNLKIILSVFALSIALFSCKKDDPQGFPIDNPVPLEKLAHKVAGYYIGTAYKDGDFYEPYELEIEEIGDNRIKVEVPDYATLEFDLMPDDVIKIIMNSDTINNHWVIYNPETTEMHFFGQRTETSGISFEGFKAE